VGATERYPQTQGEGFGEVSTGVGEPLAFPARFSKANMSLSVESTRAESLVKILW